MSLDFQIYLTQQHPVFVNQVSFLTKTYPMSLQYEQSYLRAMPLNTNLNF